VTIYAELLKWTKRWTEIANVYAKKKGNFSRKWTDYCTRDLVRTRNVIAKRIDKGAI
jgi:hypothetical protein